MGLKDLWRRVKAKLSPASVPIVEEPLLAGLKIHAYGRSTHSATYMDWVYPNASLIEIGANDEASIAEFTSRVSAGARIIRYVIAITWDGLMTNTIFGNVTIPTAAKLLHANGDPWDMQDIDPGYGGHAVGVNELVDFKNPTILDYVWAERQRLVALGVTGFREDETTAWSGITEQSFIDGDVQGYRTKQEYVDAYLAMVNLICEGRYAKYQTATKCIYYPSLSNWISDPYRLHIARTLKRVSSEAFPPGAGIFPNWVTDITPNAPYATVAEAIADTSTTDGLGSYIYALDENNLYAGVTYTGQAGQLTVLDQLRDDKDLGISYQFFTNFGSSFGEMPDYVQEQDIYFNIDQLRNADGLAPFWIEVLHR